MLNEVLCPVLSLIRMLQVEAGQVMDAVLKTRIEQDWRDCASFLQMGWSVRINAQSVTIERADGIVVGSRNLTDLTANDLSVVGSVVSWAFTGNSQMLGHKVGVAGGAVHVNGSLTEVEQLSRLRLAERIIAPAEPVEVSLEGIEASEISPPFKIAA